MEISIIIAGFNEQDNVFPLVRETAEVMRPLNRSYEIVYVNDGSTDETGEKLREAASQFSELRVITHDRNYGQSAALLSAFECIRGDVIVTMDADLQNDPKDIPRLLDELPSCHLVTGIRVKRRDNLKRKISTFVANRVRVFFLKDGIKDAGCAMRAYRKQVIKQLIPFRGLHRFLPTLCRIHGFRVRQIPVNHRPRLHGEAKYGIGNRLFVGVQDMFAVRWYKKRHISIKRKYSDDI